MDDGLIRHAVFERQLIHSASAPLFDLADHLKSKGCRVDAVIGASSASRIFAPLDGKRTVNSVTVTTEDGSAGVTGRVTDVLEELIERQKVFKEEKAA